MGNWVNQYLYLPLQQYKDLEHFYSDYPVSGFISTWFSNLKNTHCWNSLVAQWLRICLPMQGTQVQALAREDPTCRGAMKPVRHNYWTCALEPKSHNYWTRVPQLLKPTHLEPVLRNRREATAMRSLHTTKKSSPCSPQLEKAHVRQWRPNAAKN